MIRGYERQDNKNFMHTHTDMHKHIYLKKEILMADFPR